MSLDDHLHSPIVIVLVWSAILLLTGAACGCAAGYFARALWR